MKSIIANRGEKDTIIVRRVLLIGIAMFAIFIFIANFIISSEKSLSDKIYPHVTIDNRDVGRKTLKQVKEEFAQTSGSLAHVQTLIMYRGQPVATLSAQTLNIRSNANDVADRAYLIGRTDRIPSRLYQKFSTLFGFKSYNFDTSVIYDKAALQDFLTTAQDTYEKPAKNALFTFENGRVSNFRKEEKGLRLKVDELYRDLDHSVAALKKKNQPISITLSDAVIEPEITLAEANDFGIEELIGEGQSDFTHSIPERVANVILAASKFNGVLIPKGKVFSFDDTIGDISALSGYKPAYVIKNGKTVLGDGGGVCQVSTTLFRAALNTGLPIEERHAHAYRVGYYENDSGPGLDATIYSPTVDLRIRNDTPASILILTEIEKDTNILHFRMYGKKDGRKVELSPITVYDVQPAPPPVYQDDPTLKKGVTKQVDFAASGAKSKYDYKVTRGKDTLISTTFYSVYQPWKAVFLVGTAD